MKFLTIIALLRGLEYGVSNQVGKGDLPFWSRSHLPAGPARVESQVSDHLGLYPTDFTQLLSKILLCNWNSFYSFLGERKLHTENRMKVCRRTVCHPAALGSIRLASGRDGPVDCRPPASCSHVFHVNQPHSSPPNASMHIFLALESMLPKSPTFDHDWSPSAARRERDVNCVLPLCCSNNPFLLQASEWGHQEKLKRSGVIKSDTHHDWSTN